MLLGNRFGTYCLILLIIGANVLIIFMASFQKPDKDDSPDAIPGWLWPTVVFSIFGGGILAWAALVLLQSDKIGNWLGVQVVIHEVTGDGNATLPIGNTAISRVREETGPEEAEQLEIRKMLKEAKDDGTNRRLRVTVSYTE